MMSLVAAQVELTTKTFLRLIPFPPNFGICAHNSHSISLQQTESWLSFHSNIIPGIEAADDKKGNSPKPLSVVTDSKQSVDFDYDDDDDTSSGVKTPKSTIIPYFEHNVKTVYLTGEDNVTLACLPKNFNDSQHIILWYKDESPITNGNTIVSVGYEIDNKSRLTILNYNKESSGNFSCAIMPSDVRQYFVFKPQSETPENIVEKINGGDTKQISQIAIKLIAFLTAIKHYYGIEKF
uniref:Ig-like domain-containing protein n=1 Tax=Glossina palpalis gambiensis TaxID=67801 RepID=A0A1B0B9W5_9MUSC